MTDLVPARRCVLYARISVTKEESVSVERQLEAGRKLADARSWDIVGEFVDDGVSATANRPEDRAGWRALLRTPDFDAVVIWKVDRLSRKVLDFLHVDQVLQARGAGLVAVEDPIDMTTPMGRAFATILAVFGEMEAAAISARITAARAHLVKTGRHAGGGVPYGWRSVDNPDGPGKVLAQDPDRIEWTRRMVALAQGGETVNGIARWLDAHDAPLPKARRNTLATTWNRQTVEGLLRNPILAGMISRNPGASKSGKRRDGVLVDESGEPVVYDDLAIMPVTQWRELVAQLDARTSPQARPFTERVHTSPLLSKMARCDDCNRWLCRGTNQQRPTLYCPTCRQTLSYNGIGKHLEGLLLAERGAEPYGAKTVAAHWRFAKGDDLARREILLSQIRELRIRRGVVGRRFDADRVILTWAPSALEAVAA